MPEKRSRRKKNKGGRPRKEEDTVVVRLTLTLTVGQDDDMIALFNAIPPYKRPQEVISMLRGGGGIQEHIEAAQEEIEELEETLLESL